MSTGRQGPPAEAVRDGPSAVAGLDARTDAVLARSRDLHARADAALARSRDLRARSRRLLAEGERLRQAPAARRARDRHATEMRKRLSGAATPVAAPGQGAGPVPSA